MKAKYILLTAISLTLLSGCGERLLTSFKKTTKVNEQTQTDGSAKLDGDIAMDYPSPTVVKLEGSGNANISVTIGDTGRVNADKKKKESASLKKRR